VHPFLPPEGKNWGCWWGGAPPTPPISSFLRGDAPQNRSYAIALDIPLSKPQKIIYNIKCGLPADYTIATIQNRVSSHKKDFLYGPGKFCTFHKEKKAKLLDSSFPYFGYPISSVVLR
jgi:hypothetical protein